MDLTRGVNVDKCGKITAIRGAALNSGVFLIKNGEAFILDNDDVVIKAHELVALRRFVDAVNVYGEGAAISLDNIAESTGLGFLRPG